MKTLTDVLGDVLAIRGVLAAAVVSGDGEVLAGQPAGSALLERMTDTVTGALAAGVALSTLVAREHMDGEDAGESNAGDGTGTEWPAFDADGVAQAVTARDDGAVERSVQLSGSGAVGRQLMVIYEDTGPIVFTPLPGSERVVVVALGSAQDLGRARFQLRSLSGALASAEQLG